MTYQSHLKYKGYQDVQEHGTYQGAFIARCKCDVCAEFAVKYAKNTTKNGTPSL